MKIKHRIPPEAHFVSDRVTPEYQAEVDRSTAKAEVREAAALRRLDAAMSRLAKAERIKAKGQRDRAVIAGRELVEVRRQELLLIQRQMSTAPSSARSRGRGHAKRPVPDMHTL